MANQLVTSFRYPASIPQDAAHPDVLQALHQYGNNIVDLNQAR